MISKSDESGHFCLVSDVGQRGLDIPSFTIKYDSSYRFFIYVSEFFNSNTVAFISRSFILVFFISSISLLNMLVS